MHIKFWLFINLLFSSAAYSMYSQTTDSEISYIKITVNAASASSIYENHLMGINLSEIQADGFPMKAIGYIRAYNLNDKEIATTSEEYTYEIPLYRQPGSDEFRVSFLYRNDIAEFSLKRHWKRLEIKYTVELPSGRSDQLHKITIFNSDQ